MLTTHVLENKDKIKKYLYNLGLDIKKIKNENLLLTAFIHKSYASDFTGNIADNERLEFLGDSILAFVVAEKLFLDFIDLDEAKLTLYKIVLVRQETLALIAKKIKLNDFIFIGHGEEKNKGREKDVILADCLEALIGYIYLDLGLKQVKKFIEKNIYVKLQDFIKDNINIKSYKTLLQEYVQKNYKITPKYIESEEQKDEKGNVLLYKSEVYILGELKGIGFGKNKKIAQEQAAQNAYNILNFKQ